MKRTQPSCHRPLFEPTAVVVVLVVPVVVAVMVVVMVVRATRLVEGVAAVLPVAN